MRGGVAVYAAQANVQIDAEIGEKGRFRMETNYKPDLIIDQVIGLSPVTPPERSGRFAKQVENCPSASEFFPPAKRLRSVGNPKGKEPGRLFLPTLFGRKKE